MAPTYGSPGVSGEVMARRIAEARGLSEAEAVAAMGPAKVSSFGDLVGATPATTYYACRLLGLGTSGLAAHPAKWSEAVLDAMGQAMWEHFPAGDGARRVLDPFAGVGLARLASALGAEHEVVGVELEPEWAGADPRTLVGDACALPFEAASFDVVASSPCYGNRMSDHHEARDASERRTYRHKLGRPLSANSAGAMAWGRAYRRLHETAWHEAHRVLRPGGYVVLNVSNFSILDVEQRVVEFHLNTWLLLGATLVEARRVATPRYRYGANGEKRIEGELVLVLRRAEVS
jgi:SAM-dependent methyltransferase